MFEMFLINLMSVNLAQLNIFWKLVHAIHLNQPPKGFPRAKRILWKFSFSGCFPKAKKKQCDQKFQTFLIKLTSVNWHLGVGWWMRLTETSNQSVSKS